MNFLRPASLRSKRFAARGKLIHTTPTVGLSEVHVEDSEGRLLAHGTSRCFLHRLEPHTTSDSVPVPTVAPSYATLDPYLRPFDCALVPASTLEGLTGLEWLRGIINGDFPPGPFRFLLGAHLVAAEEGSATTMMPAHQWLCTPQALVYGGVIANLAHDAMAGAVHSTLPKASSYATLDLTVNFVRPVPADGRELRARARLFHRGRTFAVAGAEVVNADGKTVATASSSSMMLPGRPFPDHAADAPPSSSP
jgi:uncharacterized protein (TIGR00369 family)